MKKPALALGLASILSLLNGTARLHQQAASELLMSCLQERLKNQKEEAASNPEYGKTFKPQASKAEKQAKRKQILSNIGVHRSIVHAATQFTTCCCFSSQQQRTNRPAVCMHADMVGHHEQQISCTSACMSHEVH